jgi:hypothetical protein
MATAITQLPTETPTPTAPLSPDARDAMRRLELRLTVPAAVVRAVTQYELAALRAGALAGEAARGVLSDLDADSLAHAEDLKLGARAALAKAGRLDLVGGV